MDFAQLKVVLNLPANEPEDNWHRHKNLVKVGNTWQISETPGGWMQNTAKVGSQVYMGPNTVAYGECEITDKVILDDHAKVGGNSRVNDASKVCGNSHVYGNAEVTRNSIVGDNAEIFGNGYLSGFTRAYGNAKVEGVLIATAIACGNSVVGPDATLEGDVMICENAKALGTTRISNNIVVHGNNTYTNAILDESSIGNPGIGRMGETIVNGTHNGHLTYNDRAIDWNFARADIRVKPDEPIVTENMLVMTTGGTLAVGATRDQGRAFARPSGEVNWRDKAITPSDGKDAVTER
jgi:carbonic anhydrase/acetyltransferase-like protein (isoleucine patch superfamily)